MCVSKMKGGLMLVLVVQSPAIYMAVVFLLSSLLSVCPFALTAFQGLQLLSTAPTPVYCPHAYLSFIIIIFLYSLFLPLVCMNTLVYMHVKLYLYVWHVYSVCFANSTH